MISKIRLTNWRSHANSELVFSSGTNALLGHMGAGKTSILDAICFSLFGTCPNLQSKKLRLDDMIMKKPFEKDKAEVEAHFQVDSNVYSVKRVIEKGKGTTYSEFRENGKLMEAPSTQRVNELVSKVMKVDYDLFSKAIYSEQNALDYFLTIPRGQRMKKIDELLMIDRFEKARASAITLANKVAERSAGRVRLSTWTWARRRGTYRSCSSQSIPCPNKGRPCRKSWQRFPQTSQGWKRRLQGSQKSGSSWKS
jgi:DNA repair protein SbcC/Rad50